MLFASTTAADRRAVIDIGSNSVRLVIFAADRRVPTALLNEKVSARLGKTLQEDGRLPAKAAEAALRGLARFVVLIDAIGVQSTRVVATAAVRDAANGAEFLEQVRALGLQPELLSGADEARASACGIQCGFPDAQGVVADLGGGSLELVSIGDGADEAGVTLPLGTLRLAKLREKSPANAQRKINTLLRECAPAGMADGKALYLVGGSWRALAQFAMHQIDWPISTPHGFTMSADGMAQLVNMLAHTPARTLQRIPRIPASRIASLGDAATVLSALVRHLRPSVLVTSSFGLREGLMFEQLPDHVRRRDPLTADLADQIGAVADGSIYGQPMFEWGSATFSHETPAMARLRLAASWLAHPVRQAERPARVERALEVTLQERLVAIDAAGLGTIAAALLAYCGEREVPSAVTRLADPASLELAARWGAVMRLAQKVSGGNARLLGMTRLDRDGEALRLLLLQQPNLYGEDVEVQHKATAERLGLDVRVAEALPA